MRNNRNKFERIQFVRDLDFNTEENILINPEDSDDKHLKFLKNLDECSIRTFNELDGQSCPAYPIVKKEEAIKLIKSLKQKKYNIILATPINPADCLFAGAVMKSGDKIITEIANGPGTVRRVTHEGKIDKRYFNINTDNEKLNECLKEINDCYLDNIIFEFSYYNHPIGYKKQNFIVWEITDDGTNNSRI